MGKITVGHIHSVTRETHRANMMFLSKVHIGGYSSKKGSARKGKFKVVCKGISGTVRNSRVLFYALSV